MIFLLLSLRFCSGKGGLRLSHREQMRICTAVHAHTIALCWAGPNFLAILLLGRFALNAATTTMVLPRMQEIQRAKVTPKAV